MQQNGPEMSGQCPRTPLTQTYYAALKMYCTELFHDLQDVSRLLSKTLCKCRSQAAEPAWNNQLFFLWFRHFRFKTILVAMRRQHKFLLRKFCHSASPVQTQPNIQPHTPWAALKCCVLWQRAQGTQRKVMIYLQYSDYTWQGFESSCPSWTTVFTL